MDANRQWLRRASRPLTAAALAAMLSGTPAIASGIRPATVPEDLGAATHRIFQAQVDKAGADAFVIYENEWRGDTALLGPFGTFHLDRIIRRLPPTPYQVLLQIHPRDDVNQKRRHFIVKALLHAGIADAESRVVIGPPAAEGLYGDEAVMLYPLMLTSRFRTGGFGAGGFGGAGLGGFGGFGGFGGLGWGGFGGAGFGGGFGGAGFGGFGGYGGFGGWGGFGSWGGYGASPTSGFRGLGY
jgi:hypothetical protein